MGSFIWGKCPHECTALIHSEWKWWIIGVYAENPLGVKDYRGGRLLPQAGLRWLGVTDFPPGSTFYLQDFCSLLGAPGQVRAGELQWWLLDTFRAGRGKTLDNDTNTGFFRNELPIDFKNSTNKRQNLASTTHLLPGTFVHFNFQ